MTKCAKWNDRAFFEKAKASCERSPQTYDRIESMIDLYDDYPEISDLNPWASRPIILEQNNKVKQAAIKAIKAKMDQRANVGDSKFVLSHATLTGVEVQKILREQRILIDGTDIERAKLAQEKEHESTDLPTRDKVVSLRATEAEDEAFTWLAKAFGVDRSYVLSVFLEFSLKFPEFLSGKH